MKKLFLIAIMMVAALSVNAQNEAGQWSVKPMAGINLAKMTKIDDSKLRVGVVAGLDFEYGVAENFGLSFGALYSMQGVKVDYAGIKETAKYDYINVPILANYYVVPGLAIKAGIQPGFNVKKPSGVDDVKTFNLSVPVGLSYEICNFVIDARYNWGLTKVVKDVNSKHSYFSFTLGYRIPF